MLALMTDRNLFLTRTVIGAYLSIIALFTAVSPHVEGLLTRGKTDTEKLNIRDWIAIVLGVTGATGTLIGRYHAGGVYTPKGIPGIDPIDTPPQDPPERLQ
jgi:hypothetical protein